MTPPTPIRPIFVVRHLWESVVEASYGSATRRAARSADCLQELAIWGARRGAQAVVLDGLTWVESDLVGKTFRPAVHEVLAHPELLEQEDLQAAPGSPQTTEAPAPGASGPQQSLF
jgi:hypothetical protein